VGFFRGPFGRWLAGIPILSALVGCIGKTSMPPAPLKQSVNYPGSFRIKETASSVQAEGTEKVWSATAIRGDRIAQFRVELLIKAEKGDALFTFTKGAFMREAGSDGKWFLAELVHLLGAKDIPEKVTPSDRLEFDATILGTSMSRQAGADQFAGSFTSTPPGHWITIKIFVAGGEGEFYLNLNPTDSHGEISLKDEEYGNIVVRELARILLSKDGA
jgi:hypothetical protein